MTQSEPRPGERLDRDAREAAFKREVAANLRRNYVANFIHGMLGLTGFRLLYAPTLMPAYIHLLTGSAALVGLGQALLQLGAVLSPVAGAAHIEHRRRVLPHAIRVGSLMRVQILGLALAAWVLSGQPLLLATLLLLFLLGVFSGMQRVAFQMLIAKVIPIEQRGRLQGWRNLTGGAIAAGLSYFAGRVLIERNVLGNGYAATFVLVFVLTSLGLLALQLFVREPEAHSVRAQAQISQRVREFPSLLADRNYRWFIVAQGLAIAGRFAAPFYILFASVRLGVPLGGDLVGLLSLAFLGADTCSNLLWGHMGDRYGYRLTFLTAVGVWIAATILLLAATSETMIVLSFCGLGAAGSGYMMSAGTMVLEFGAQEDMAMRLALSTMVEGAILTVGPLAGGLIVRGLGYSALLSLTLVFLVAAFLVLWFRVREPRALARLARGG
jgi:MFS family permease